MRGCALKTSGDTFVTGPSVRHDGDLILSRLGTCTLTIVTAPPAEIARATRASMVTAYITTSAMKILPPLLFPHLPTISLIEAGGCTVSLPPHSTLSHSAPIVQLGSEPGDVT